MTINVFEPYQVSNEYNVTEILAHFDADYIISALEDKLKTIDYTSSLIEPNYVASFEENFKMMNEQFPGDSDNIRAVRGEVYTTIINLLTERFNLQFNSRDDTIDLYTAAYYLYDFLVNNRNEHMVRFFAAFIINNKDSLCRALDTEGFRKNKDVSAAYSKRIYDNSKYALISANMMKVVDQIATIDISLYNIFQSIYSDPTLVNFMDNAVADKGNFFRDYYCAPLHNPEINPIIITNIRLALQRLVGSDNGTYMDELIMGSKKENNN